MFELNSKSIIKKLILITIFAIAMAYLESAAVVYLREIFSISTFLPEALAIGEQDIAVNLGIIVFLKVDSALNILGDSKILFTEIGREAATIIMLFSFAWLVGKKYKEKLAVFLWTFAWWDIFYYIWLYILIRWPSSLLEPDVLFLIPIPWVSPVILPVAISVLMIAVAIWLFKVLSKN